MKQYDQQRDDSRELKHGEYVAEPASAAMAYGNESKRSRTPPPKMPPLSQELGARVAVVETTLAHVQQTYATNLDLEKFKEEIRQIVREEIKAALKDVTTKDDLHTSETVTRKEVTDSHASTMRWLVSTVVGVSVLYGTTLAALVIYLVERLA